MHPIQETGKRPTAALDRNLAYLGLVEVLHGYPLDGVVLTTGCDKTTPACLMPARQPLQAQSNAYRFCPHCGNQRESAVPQPTTTRLLCPDGTLGAWSLVKVSLRRH